MMMSSRSGRLGVAVVALAIASPAVAQFSDGFNFLKAVRDKDGNKVTELLNKPGTTVVNARDDATGEGALHIVVKRREPTWLRFMLGRGANPDMRDGAGNTPLMLAAQLGWTEGAQILLAGRASVDAANNSGETPLIRAVQNRDVATVRLLLGAGANPNRADSIAGMSARDYATRDPRAAVILAEIVNARPVVRRPVAGPH